MSADKIECPSCRTKINADLTFGGPGNYRCPQCWHEFSLQTIPEPAADVRALASDQSAEPPVAADQPETGELRDSVWLQQTEDYSQFTLAQPAAQAQHQEIGCPFCGASVGVDEPDTYRCAKCGGVFRYPEGTPLDKHSPDRPLTVSRQYVDLGRAGKAGEDSESVVTEDPESLPFFSWLVRSLGSLIFHPVAFFRYLPSEGGIFRPLAFAAIWYTLGALIGTLLALAGVTSDESLRQTGMGPLGLLTIIFIIVPPAIALGMFVVAGLNHLMLIILKANSNGYWATLRATCYASGVQVFQVIPVIGMLSGLWMLALTVIGLKEAHSISYGKAIAAVLLPIAALCGCGLILSVFFRGIASSMLGG